MGTNAPGSKGMHDMINGIYMSAWRWPNEHTRMYFARKGMRQTGTARVRRGLTVSVFVEVAAKAAGRLTGSIGLNRSHFPGAIILFLYNIIAKKSKRVCS